MFLSIQGKGSRKYVYLVDFRWDNEKKSCVRTVIQSFGNYDKMVKEHPEKLEELKAKYGTHQSLNEARKQQALSSFAELHQQTGEAEDGTADKSPAQAQGALVTLKLL